MLNAEKMTENMKTLEVAYTLKRVRRENIMRLGKCSKVLHLGKNYILSLKLFSTSDYW